MSYNTTNNLTYKIIRNSCTLISMTITTPLLILMTDTIKYSTAHRYKSEHTTKRNTTQTIEKYLK